MVFILYRTFRGRADIPKFSPEKFPFSAWPCCILITNLQLAWAELGTTGLSFLYGLWAFILQYGGNMEFENHHDGNENVAKLNVIAATCFVARDLETIILWSVYIWFWKWRSVKMRALLRCGKSKDNEQSRERWVGERSKPGGAWHEKWDSHRFVPPADSYFVRCRLCSCPQRREPAKRL